MVKKEEDKGWMRKWGHPGSGREKRGETKREREREREREAEVISYDKCLFLCDLFHLESSYLNPLIVLLLAF